MDVLNKVSLAARLVDLRTQLVVSQCQVADPRNCVKATRSSQLLQLRKSLWEQPAAFILKLRTSGCLYLTPSSQGRCEVRRQQAQAELAERLIVAHHGHRVRGLSCGV